MNKRINISLTLLAILVLSACKVSKDISNPAPLLPANFRNGNTEDTANIANIKWQDFFTQSSLQKLISTAITNNFDMQTALKNIESANLVLAQTKYAYLPDARLQIGANINRPSDNSLNGISLSQFLGQSYIEDYSTSIGLSWEADIWGKIKNQKAAALASYLQTNEAKKAIQTNLVSSISQGYYNLLMLDQQLQIAKKNVLLSDSTLRIAQLQLKASEVTQLAVEQVEAQKLVAAQLVPQFEQAIILQENALSILTGLLPDKIERDENLTDITIPANTATGIPAALLSKRPDIKTQELALQIANANVGITKASMYPSLSITATGGINAFKASNWFNIPASLFGAAAGGITQPLFQRKQLRTQFEVAKVNREKVVIQFRQSVLNAVGEVSDALAKVEKLKAQQLIIDQRQNTLTNAIKNAGLLFRNGMANYLEVITAQSNVLQNELQSATIKRAQLAANVELYKALGGGWE
ncbi:TolC family protein [Polluticaenibacter yanchengensis]|uniref:Efflux transporter outer membrane subunit n=1 Tax=Polluticaenibacter yanchengensis TaxID=3014562 RepID=A0ABT4UHX1_9BACT|nr:efflux transporter outer membrane subunit [Chitinophagaceae bacterium LY-5]